LPLNGDPIPLPPFAVTAVLLGRVIRKSTGDGSSSFDLNAPSAESNARATRCNALLRREMHGGMR
jgi:hypothetical protein